MFRNYLKAAWRNLRRQKAYAVINIAGLAVGLAGCILIFLYVADEMSFDRFHEREASIRRVLACFHKEDGSVEFRTSSMPAGAAPLFPKEFPEIEYAVRFGAARGSIRAGEAVFAEEVAFTDPGVFALFSFPLISGDPASVLAGEDSLVLTRSAAAKFFGGRDPVGQTATLAFGTSQRDFRITGVAEDPPRNSTIQFQALIRAENLAWATYDEALTNLGDFSYPLFIGLNKEASPQAVAARLDAFTARAFAAEFGRWGYDPTKRKSLPVTLELQELRDMHFDSYGPAGSRKTSEDGADPAALLILGGIGLAVLLIAGINFVNLSLGRSTVRLPEIGLRKVVGAGRWHLVQQFWAEALVLAAAALAAAVLVATLVLPAFNRLAGKVFTPADLLRPGSLAAMAAMLLAVTLVSGLYPALAMSVVSPVDAFRGRTTIGGKRPVTRALVAIQFALSVFLIVSTFVLGGQIRYLIARDPGYDRQGLIHVRLPSTMAEENQPLVDLFRNRVRPFPGVIGVSASNSALGRNTAAAPIKLGDRRVIAYQFRVDPAYLATMGLKLIDGRDFEPAETGVAIINREFARVLGATAPVGRTIGDFADGSDDAYPNNLRIIGVVEDYNVISLKYGLSPLFIQREPKWGMWNLIVRVRREGIAATIRELEAVWAEIVPSHPFAFTFLEDDLKAQYASEVRWGGIVRLSSLFAVVIAGMGIFGLTLLSVRRRFKEIGIRKVLGAGVGQVVALVGRELVLLVAASNLVAWPAAYFVMRRYLDGYHYRIGLGPGFFLAAGVVSLAVAALTAGGLGLKAALSDPVKAIRYE
jgi:putative ABC transport system permease protein